MKKKWIVVGVIFLFIIVFCILNFSTEVEKNVENEVEIQPEEEVAEEQNYDTTIKLYYLDETSNLLVPENRIVDARKLIDNPYKYILELLIKNPQSSNLKKAIPEGTIVNSASLKKGIVYIDFNEEFLNGSGTEAIYSIVNTMCEFNEVDGVKFTINGEEKENLKEKFVKKE